MPVDHQLTLSTAAGRLARRSAAGESRVLAMPDIYLDIAHAPPAVVEPLIDTLELRAADPGQQAMREAYLAEVGFPPAARVVEVGCGPGPVARALAARKGVTEVVGVDPSRIFIAKARELGRELPNLRFLEGDAQALPLDDGSYDVVVFHTTLCHVLDPELALAEARRVLRLGGQLAIFDGDYVTATCASGAQDPLQACLQAAVDNLVHDPWLVRRLPALVTAAGYDVMGFRGHSYLEAPSSRGYLLALIDRGADVLCATGRISRATADACQAEARRRSDANEFFGHIAYGSLIARTPAAS
jgi:SAM-dependent methyltransferase